MHPFIAALLIASWWCLLPTSAHAQQAQPEGEPCLTYPEVFTPNGEGETDRLSWTLHCEGIQLLNIKVFDRWGQLYFMTTTWDGSWDGTFKKRPAPPGVYHWVIEFRWISGNTVHKLQGTVTLVR
ncbi:MAG: gliding motility-associated C-terminal domain-containing protein [Saprospiraceae bacterium]|nr:gliding motility-associated C-terminal domain-containing protein [Saprospiraceae bacterium]